jgi:hypothetical protein
MGQTAKKKKKRKPEMNADRAIGSYGEWNLSYGDLLTGGIWPFDFPLSVAQGRSCRPTFLKPLGGQEFSMMGPKGGQELCITGPGIEHQ